MRLGLRMRPARQSPRVKDSTWFDGNQAVVSIEHSVHVFVCTLHVFLLRRRRRHHGCRCAVKCSQFVFFQVRQHVDDLLAFADSLADCYEHHEQRPPAACEHRGDLFEHPDVDDRLEHNELSHATRILVSAVSQQS